MITMQYKPLYLPQVSAPADYVLNQLKDNGVSCTQIEVKPNKLTPIIIDSTAPVEAPLETPNIYGSAREFLVRACMRTPTRDNPPPTKNAKNIRGSRNFNKIISKFGFQVGSNVELFVKKLMSILNVVDRSTLMTPYESAKIVVKTPKSIKNINVFNFIGELLISFFFILYIEHYS